MSYMNITQCQSKFIILEHYYTVVYLFKRHARVCFGLIITRDVTGYNTLQTGAVPSRDDIIEKPARVQVSRFASAAAVGIGSRSPRKFLFFIFLFLSYILMQHPTTVRSKCHITVQPTGECESNV